MPLCTPPDITETKNVGMGQVALARGPACLKAVLGSCVGVALYHARWQLGVLCHVVLPHGEGRAGVPGKFADTAIPHMLQLLAAYDARPAGLIAKIAGGACMFGNGGPLQIGEANIKVVSQVLASAGIRLAAKDVGGNSGRRVTFDCQSGALTVESVGSPPRIL